MKANIKSAVVVRVLSLLMAMMVLVTGCVNTNTEDASGDNSQAGQETEGATEPGTQESSSTQEQGTQEQDSQEPDSQEPDSQEPDSQEPVAPSEPELTAEEKLWQTRLLANAKNNLNVRKEPSTSSKIVGKLERGDLAIIVEKGEEWTKIVSGNVEGYVYNQYCLFGNEAMKQAKEIGKSMAIVQVDHLRIRKEPNTNSKIVVKLMKGDKIEVNEDIEPVDGWVAVIYEEQTCYMSADYLVVDVELSTGMTMEEIEEQKRLEEERKKEEEERKQKEKEQKAVDDATDLELLAALIYCEAGGEPYDAQLAVGACVMNRMKHKNYPDTLRGVIFQKNQFTPAMSGKVARILIAGKTTQSCFKAAAAALAGEDNTNGCRSFRLASTGRQGIIYGKIVFFSNN